MSANPQQARDEILATFQEAWASTGVPVLYADRAQDVPDDGAWARISVQHQDGNQATLSGAVGQRRFRHTGTVFVQVFTPFDDGMVQNDELVMIAKDAFEGTVTSPGGVIFRRVRINEVGQDGQWFQTNVLASFEYDQIR